MIEIFKTNVTTDLQVQEITALLIGKYPACRINFDLQDCDKILRVKSDVDLKSNIINLMRHAGFECEQLA
jgi:hypothetical protein